MFCAPDILGKTTCRAVAACLFAASSLSILPTGAAAQVTVPTDPLDVLEGSSAQFTVSLDSQPTDDVTITIGQADDDLNDDADNDADLTVDTGKVSEDGKPILIFESGGNTSQTVTVKAAEDVDRLAGTKTFVFSSVSDDLNFNNVSISDVTATEVENDVVGVTILVDGRPVPVGSGLSVPEGGSATYTLMLNAAPFSDEVVTITLGRAGSGGDTDLAAVTGEFTVPEPGTDEEPKPKLTFNGSNWNTPQTVTVSAEEDDDGVDGTATITHDVDSTDKTPGGYDGHGIGGITVTEADNDPIGVTVSPRVLAVPEGGTATYTVVLNTKPTDAVTIEPSVDQLSDPNLTVSTENDDDTLTFTTSNWNEPQTVEVEAAEDTDRLDGTATISHSVASLDEFYDTIDDTSPRSVGSVTAVEDDDERNVIQARFGRLNEEILSKHALAVADTANRAIGARLEDACGARAAAFTLAGGSTVLGALQSNAQAIEDGTLTLGDVLAGASFVLPLSAANNGKTGGPGKTGKTGGPVLWGRGSLQRLEGTDSAFPWDGAVRTGQLGIDTCLRKNLVTGLILSHSAGDFDYTADAGTGPVRGRYSSRMTGLHPYLGWSSPQGLTLWATAGYGRGDIEIDDEEVGRQVSDTALKTAAAGVRGPLITGDSPIAGSTMALGLRSEASWAQVGVGGDGDLIEKQTVNAWRLRLALEGSHTQALAAGGSLTASVELGLRHDGGDGATGSGLELGAGLSYRHPTTGVTVAGDGRILIGQDGYREWGLGGSVRFGPGARGRGLSFSLAPAWGDTASGLDRLWERDAAALTAHDGAANGGAANDNAPPMRLEAELGYGFGAYGGRGLLTPYGGFSLAGEGAQRYRIGGRFEIGSSLDLSLEGTRHEPANDADAEHSIMLNGQVRW